jgi:hypothetical protein
MEKSLRLDNQQETLLELRGSSETTRETSFNFGAFNPPSHIIHFDNGFLEWFVGFSEGDASFILSRGRPFFIINQKDPKVLYYLRSKLGFGKVASYAGYYRFGVYDLTGIRRLISIFNGNLVLNKTRVRFKQWLINFDIPEVAYVRLESLDFLGNAWLSGFIDAQGCFYALMRKEVTRSFSYRLKFFLDQACEPVVLKTICSAFPVAHIVVRDFESGYSRLVIEAAVSRIVLIRYLSAFPLHSVKLISFQRWSRLHRILLFDRIALSNIEKLKRLIRCINVPDEKDDDIVQPLPETEL